MRTRLLIEAIMLPAFVAGMLPQLTGITLHEWLSVALIVPLFVHLVVNWDVSLAMAKRLFGRLRAARKLDLALDVPLLVAAVTAMLSGLVISQSVSRVIGYAASLVALWHTVHAISAEVTIALVITHTVMHFGRLVNALDRVFLERQPPAAKRPTYVERSW